MSFALTDTGNAERFAEQHRARARYVAAWAVWLIWDERHWRRDDRNQVDLLSKDTARSIDTEVRQCVDDDRRKMLRAHATRTESARGRRDMVTLARAELAAVPDEFDRDPWLLNVANGTIDLRTGTLREHRREDMITHVIDIAYDPTATCPTFEAFLRRVLADPELIAFMQKAVGYSLTGTTLEQCFFFLHGDGANGKSTLADALLKLLGPYGKAGAPDLLMARHNDQHPAEQADLEGSRLVVCQEIAEGRTWNERALKHLTGGDRIKARLMHENWREFTPTHKIWIAANPKPKMREGGLATWRRVRLIPFDIVIPPEERDRELSAKLEREMPGILRWAVEGCLRWRREGLEPPRAVAAATHEYAEQSDHVRLFADERLVFGPECQVSKSALYEAYTAWCRYNREAPKSRHDLQKRLLAFGGVSEARSARDRGLIGVALRPLANGVGIGPIL